MPGLTDRGRRLRGVMLGLGLCAVIALMAVGLFEGYAARPAPPPVPAPAPGPEPGRTVEVAPGTATNGHFTIRLLSGAGNR